MSARATAAARLRFAIRCPALAARGRFGRAAFALIWVVAARAIVAQPSDLESVRREALYTYYHGITAELAQERIGPQGVPALLELLADPSFPRRDNVVAFLTYLGAGESTSALLEVLASPPAPVTLPEEDRALLLLPQALGHIAARGEPRALEALLEMTAAGSNGGVLAAAASRSSQPACAARRSAGDGGAWFGVGARCAGDGAFARDRGGRGASVAGWARSSCGRGRDDGGVGAAAGSIGGEPGRWRANREGSLRWCRTVT